MPDVSDCDCNTCKIARFAAELVGRKGDDDMTVGQVAEVITMLAGNLAILLAPSFRAHGYVQLGNLILASAETCLLAELPIEAPQATHAGSGTVQ